MPRYFHSNIKFSHVAASYMMGAQIYMEDNNDNFSQQKYLVLYKQYLPLQNATCFEPYGSSPSAKK